jgi:hypothetical protein
LHEVSGSNPGRQPYDSIVETTDTTTGRVSDVKLSSGSINTANLGKSLGPDSGPPIASNVAFTPDGKYLYLHKENYFGKNLYVFSTASSTVSATFSGNQHLGDRPDRLHPGWEIRLCDGAGFRRRHGLGHRHGNQRVGDYNQRWLCRTCSCGCVLHRRRESGYVPDYGLGVVSVIATAPNTIAATVGVGNAPTQVAIAPQPSGASFTVPAGSFKSNRLGSFTFTGGDRRREPGGVDRCHGNFAIRAPGGGECKLDRRRKPCPGDADDRRRQRDDLGQGRDPLGKRRRRLTFGGESTNNLS